MKLDSFLQNVRSVGIAGHVRPDGDSVGSSLAVYNYIKTWYAQIDVDLYLEDFSESFMFLKNADQAQHQCTKDKQYDLFIALDSGDLERLGEAVKYFKTAKKTLCIDHHISNVGYADENRIVADASSTCELTYLALEEEKITKEIAEALYMGIVHDTGVFQFSCTSAQTMRIAGKLMETGIDFSKIVEETYYQKTFHQNQILGRALLESFLFFDGRAIVSVIRKKTMRFYNVTSKDLDGIVNQLRITKGVKCALFLYEIEPSEFKVSFRSNGDVDVCKIAMFFGGGGHVRAAGCTMFGNMYDVINSISKKIAEQLEEETQEK